MNKEEQKAIERLSIKATTSSIEAINYPNAIVMKKDIKTVLNLIDKQQKVIDEMAEAVYDYANLGTIGICPAEIENGCINFDLCDYFGKKDINCLKCVKQYFYRKVENDE